ncbi:hypothetical protein P6144_12220 [Sphingomonas sp. HITSZ_GF]|uniref:hypothetical protein n=1 Tax=Sphingomonas sp. HITSZ_GF TaxID=3037247 RepID=UPI00240CF68C|nr:hypothetical protein [Sphingomonas sp. HITSZ_GF]MDG2534420.1 hypothetical protein [Sphingomonas sp. HITSZ_GF]
MKMLPILLAAALAATPALAHDSTTFAPVPKGGVSWETLGATEQLPWVDAAGANRIAPGFTPAVEALDGKLVTIAGYAMLDDEQRGAFTLYASEVDCEFHVSPGPNLRAEVSLAKAQVLKPGALVVRGRLELVRARQGGVFFRIRDAVVTPA